jgi:uncharacterized protein HemX
MDTKTVLIGLLVGLLIGAGLGYGASLPQMNTLQSQVTLLDGQVTTLKTEADKVPGLQKQVTDLTDEKTSLTSQITMLQEQLITKTNEVATLNDQLTAAQTQITTKDSQIATLQTQITAKNNEISTLTTQISDRDAQILALQEQIPPYTKGAWNTIKTFSSSGEVNTELFNIPQSEARIVWTYSETGYLPYMYVELYKQGITFRVWSSGEILTSTGTTYIYNLTTGNYYLNIDPSLGVGSWNVKIEAWVPA